MTPPFPIPDFAIRRFQETGGVSLVWPVVPPWSVRSACDIRWLERNDEPEIYGAGGVWVPLALPARPGDVLEVAVGDGKCEWDVGYEVGNCLQARLPVADVGAKRFSEATVDEWLDAGVRTYGETWRATSCGIEQFLRDAADEWNEQHGHLGPEYLAEADPWVWMATCEGGE